MLKSSSVLASVLLLSLQSGGASAQNLDMEAMQKTVAIFSNALEEALELRGERGLFGIASGGVKGTYLYQQGVVLTVQTPLAGQRNRLSLSNLQSSIQNLTVPGNPFLPVQRPAIPATPEIMTLTLRQDSVGDFYRELMSQLAEADVSATVGAAILSAADSVRSLRANGLAGDQSYGALQAEIETMRERLARQSESIREFEAELRLASNSSDDGIDVDARQTIQNRLNDIVASVTAMQAEILVRVNELAQRSELARAQYLQQWQQDVEDFENSMYQSLCSYATGLRELADDEKLTIILSGLGIEAKDGRRTDKHHVLNKADLTQCQSGAIDVSTLQQRSVSYSF